jgi:hypothetical protein
MPRAATRTSPCASSPPTTPPAAIPAPVLNADGNLVGINFDRVWEGTMSDLVYDPEICRNISLDVRYILFIIKEIGHAAYLLDEMTFVD